MKKRKAPLMAFVQSFFQDYLAANRGLSANTILAYRDALKMFLQFVADQRKIPVAKLDLDDLTASVALEFLHQLDENQKE